MAKVMREAELDSRSGDEQLSAEQLLKISIFSGLKAAVLERYPGALVLRRYAKNEIVCRQGEPGWTAFYILKTEDLLAIREDDQGNEPVQALRGRSERLTAATAATQSVTEYDPSLALLDPNEKRNRAVSVEAENPDLAEQLRLSAEGDDLRAAATVSLTVPARRASTAIEGSVWSRTMKRLFGVRRSTSTSTLQNIPIDGPVDLQLENPVATLYEGELFGEMSCLNRHPRSATVRVTRDCYMIEMLRNILELLQKNKAFKEEMDAVYRRRVLDAHLRSLPLFRDVEDDVLTELRARVELVTMEPGEVLFNEGDPSDSVYVIRIGIVKVTQKAPGGERVLAYRSRGEYVGEIGLLRDEPRMATCTVLDHPVIEGEKKRRAGRVELIRIAKDDLLKLLDRYPQLRSKVEAEAAKRIEPETGLQQLPVSRSTQFDDLGLLQGQKLMLIDLDRCTRCDECVRACANTHADGLTRLLREGPRFGRYLVPSSCRQCLDPVCMIGCPVGSIHKGASGQIVIEDWCIGCEICAKQCPYDAINMHDLALASAETDGTNIDVTQQAVVCDQCSSLSGGTPSCVYACPHDAALRVDARSFFAAHAETGTYVEESAAAS